MEKTRRFCSAKTKQFYGGMEKFSNAGNLITERLSQTTMNYHSIQSTLSGKEHKERIKKRSSKIYHYRLCLVQNFHRGRISKLNYTINDQFLPPPAIVALISESSSSSPRIASWRWRGVIRFTFRSLEAFPANSSTYVRKDTHVSLKR